MVVGFVFQLASKLVLLPGAKGRAAFQVLPLVIPSTKWDTYPIMGFAYTYTYSNLILCTYLYSTNPNSKKTTLFFYNNKHTSKFTPMNYNPNSKLLFYKKTFKKY
jgi:hypothetical protein